MFKLMFRAVALKRDIFIIAVGLGPSSSPPFVGLRDYLPVSPDTYVTLKVKTAYTSIYNQMPKNWMRMNTELP